MRIPESDFIMRFDRIADHAMSEPVTITRDGRDHLVLLSAGEYARLMRRDRRAVLAGALTDEEAALIAAAEVPE